MTKPAGQSGRLSLGKKNCFDICLNKYSISPGFSWTSIIDAVFGATASWCVALKGAPDL